MSIKQLILGISFISVFFNTKLYACSPCGALSNVTQTINGTNLELTFTSNAGWNCCYTVNIEIICENASFSGVANYFSAEICMNGGTQPSTTNTLQMPYPLTVIDLSGYCPGNYKWRAWETSCNIYTAEQTFTVAGASPIVVDASLADDSICASESTQFTASASNGCNNGTYNYSWSPATGLNNANIANPVASPTQTTNYVLTVTETGSCTAPQTVNFTVTVNPSPTATISGTTELCQNSASPDVVFTGADATAPYTINYTLNGVAQTPIVTSGSTTITAPTNTAGVFIYALTSIEESSTAQCFQNQTGSATITINALPVVNAGTDQILCEPNGVTPSDVTLSGSGAVTYSWNNDVVDGVAFTPPSGVTIYTVTGTDANGCIDTDDVSVTALTLPVANGAPTDTYGNAPMTIEFSNSSQYASSYSWDYGNGDNQNTNSTSNVSSTYTIPGVYEIILTASNGICYDTASMFIEVIPPMIVTPPNVFTPNEDGSNDLYFVDVKYGEHFEAIILNRWGNVITTLDTLNQGWDGKTDGKLVEEGVYFIKYKATDFSGIENDGHTYFHLMK